MKTTRKLRIYLGDVRSVLRQLLCKRQRDIRILPTYAATATQRRWLWPVKFALEGTVASEVGIPGLSRTPICRSRIE
jgi:hypothetical protein